MARCDRDVPDVAHTSGKHCAHPAAGRPFQAARGEGVHTISQGSVCSMPTRGGGEPRTRGPEPRPRGVGFKEKLPRSDTVGVKGGIPCASTDIVLASCTL